MRILRKLTVPNFSIV